MKITILLLFVCAISAASADDKQELLAANKRPEPFSQRRNSISSVTVQLHLNDEKQNGPSENQEDDDDYPMDMSPGTIEDFMKVERENYSYNKIPKERMDSGSISNGPSYRYLLNPEAFMNKQPQMQYVPSPSNNIQFVSTPAPPVRHFSTPAPQSVSNQIPHYNQYLSGQESNIQYVATPAPPQFGTTPSPLAQFGPSMSNFPQFNFGSTPAPEHANFGSNSHNGGSQQQVNNALVSTSAPRISFGSTQSPAQQFLSQLSNNNNNNNQLQFLSTPSPPSVFVSTPSNFVSTPSPSVQYSTGSSVFNNRLSPLSGHPSDNHMNIIHFDNAMTGVRSPQHQSSNVFVSSTPDPLQISNDAPNSVQENNWRNSFNNNLNELLKLANNNNQQNQIQQFNNQLEPSDAGSSNHMIYNVFNSNQKPKKYKNNQREIVRDEDHSQAGTSDFGWKLSPKKPVIHDAQASSLYSLATLENNSPNALPLQSSAPVAEYHPYPDNPFLSHISFPTAAPSFKAASIQSVNIQPDNNREQNVNLGYSIGFGQHNEALKADQTSYTNKFPFINLGQGFTTAHSLSNNDIVKGVQVSQVNAPQNNLLQSVQEYSPNGYKNYEKVRSINSIQDNLNVNNGPTIFATTVAPSYKVPQTIYKESFSINNNKNYNTLSNNNNNNNDFNSLTNNNNNYNGLTNNNNNNNNNFNGFANQFNSLSNNQNSLNLENSGAKSVQHFQGMNPNIFTTYGSEIKHDGKGFPFKWSNFGSGIEISGGNAHASTIKPTILSTPETVTPNSVFYLNNEVITNSPVIFSNQREPVNGKLVQNFDHANAIKNIQPIDLTNVLPYSPSPLGDASKGVAFSPQMLNNQVASPNNNNIFKGFEQNEQNAANLLQQSFADFLNNYKPLDQSSFKDKNVFYNVPSYKPQFSFDAGSLGNLQGSNMFVNRPKEHNAFESNNNYQIKPVEMNPQTSYLFSTPGDMLGHSSNIETRHVNHMEYVPSDLFRSSKAQNLNSVPSTSINQLSNPEYMGYSTYQHFITHPTFNLQQYNNELLQRLNQNIGLHQMEPALSASDNSYRFMSNKNDRQNTNDIIRFDKQNSANSQNGEKVTKLQEGSDPSTPYTIEIDEGFEQRDGVPNFDQIEVIHRSKPNDRPKKKKKYKQSGDFNKFRESFGEEMDPAYHSVSNLASEQLQNNVQVLTAHQIGAVIDQQPPRMRSQDGASAPELELFSGFEGPESIDPRSQRQNDENQQSDSGEVSQQLKEVEVDEPYPLLTPPKPPNGSRQFRKKHERRPVVPRKHRLNRLSRSSRFQEDFEELEPALGVRSSLRSLRGGLVKRKMG